MVCAGVPRKHSVVALPLLKTPSTVSKVFKQSTACISLSIYLFQFRLSPTGEANPQFVTVSGDKGIYAVPFDLDPGTWTVAVKIVNDDPEAREILVVSHF